MDVFFTCQYEEDPIENRGARVLTTLYINFSDAQGQITLELVVVSSRNLNSFKLLCISSLPARMRMIDSKMKELEFSQDIMLPPCKGRETYCSSPCVRLCVCGCLSVCLSVTKSCPLYNLKTVTDISTKLHTVVKHIETTCHAQEP